MFGKGTSWVAISDGAVPCSTRRDTGPISGPRAHDGHFKDQRGGISHTVAQHGVFGAFFGWSGLFTTTTDMAFTDGCINEGSNTASKNGRMALMMVQIPRLEDEVIDLVRAFYDYGSNDGSDTASLKRADALGRDLFSGFFGYGV